MCEAVQCLPDRGLLFRALSLMHTHIHHQWVRANIIALHYLHVWYTKAPVNPQCTHSTLAPAFMRPCRPGVHGLSPCSLNI